MRKLLLWVGIAFLAIVLGGKAYDGYQNTVNLKSAQASLDQMQTGAVSVQDNTVRTLVLVGLGVICVIGSFAVRPAEK